MKKSLLILPGVVVLIFGFFLLTKNLARAPLSVSQTPETEVTEETKENSGTPEAIDMCYYYTKAQPSGFSDVASLKMNITGPNGSMVTGEYKDIPAEKDKKVGTFEGTAGQLNQTSMSRTAELIWTSMAEGMTNKEELIVEFGDGSAVALYGEMVDRGDGVYVYKDKTRLTPGPALYQVDCSKLE